MILRQVLSYPQRYRSITALVLRTREGEEVRFQAQGAKREQGCDGSLGVLELYSPCSVSFRRISESIELTTRTAETENLSRLPRQSQQAMQMC
jgi:hypothetical protein